VRGPDDHLTEVQAAVVVYDPALELDHGRVPAELVAGL
jgi:hypothetical protein